MGGSSGASNQTIGFRYYMSIHMGIARGPINEIVEIRAGDKMVFPIPAGEPVYDGPYPSATMPKILTSGAVPLNAAELFGGDKGEGGIAGSLLVFMGTDTQAPGAALSATMGPDVPDCRGVVTLFYDGLICSLNPYPKAWKFRCRRTTEGWDGEPWHPELAKIPMLNGAVIAYNPAHIIYEASTNRDWGRGFPRTRLDDASFLKAAKTLSEEAFGLCLRYNRQENLDQFVKTIIDHIGGSLYTSRETGLLTLKLIRNDYVYDDVPLFEYDSGLLSVERPEVASREDAANEIIVKYRDQIRNEERSVRVHNLASIQTYGVRNTTTVEYPAIPSDSLATRVAHRDLRVASAANRRYTVKLDRSAWRLVPGDVFRISAPDKGIGDILLRAGSVKTGDITDGTIEVVAIPDIFGLPKGSFVTAQSSTWERPNRNAREAFNRTAREATYRDLAKVLSRADLAQIQPTEGYVCAFATKPTELSLLFTLATKTSSEADYIIGDNDSFSPTLTLSAAIGFFDTTVNVNPGRDAGNIVIPCAAQIGDEIVRVDGIDLANGKLYITRGCVDTIPIFHPANTPILCFDGALCFDRREYAQGEVVNCKFLTVTSSETLELNSTNAVNTNVTARQGRPYGAANLRVNGASMHGVIPSRDDTVIEWYHRDRTLLQDQLIGFYEGDHVLESGVSYAITIFDAQKVYRSVSNITAQSYTYTKDMATQDGLTAGQSFTIQLRTMRGAVAARQELYVLVKLP